MAISLGSDLLYNRQLQSKASEASIDKLSSTISGLSENSTDEELMSACKSFEEYLIEQVVKSTKETLLENNEEKNSKYLSMFSDNLNQHYAKLISDHSNLGIAQMLYDSIKRNGQ
ncbi:MAG: hypothetical protein K6G60_02055 [Lachnospiraceae bacterium]|nr:hypothetical protein [Lachnospiraceae bacterium]